jgi:hypothetical protein
VYDYVLHRKEVPRSGQSFHFSLYDYVANGATITPAHQLEQPCVVDIGAHINNDASQKGCRSAIRCLDGLLAHWHIGILFVVLNMRR